MPAIQRYRSNRIEFVYNAAKSLGFRFLILSGKYGLLESSDKIPYYDYLLQSSEVSEHAIRVADQLEPLGVKELIFFTRSLADDENVKPYIDCINFASLKVGINLKIIELPTNDDYWTVNKLK